MSTNEVQEQIATLRAALSMINQALNKYERTSKKTVAARDTSDSMEQAREQLTLAFKKMILEAQDPRDALMDFCFHPIANAAMATAIGMKIPQTLPEDDTAISAADLAKASGADENLVVRIMRILCLLDFAKETRPRNYTHGRITRYIADNPVMLGLTRYVSNCFHPGFVYLNKNLKANGYREPAPVDHANQAFDKLQPHIVPLIVDYPEREADYTFLMDFNFAEKFDPAKYPFPERFAHVPENEIALVDVGGSTGQLLDQIAAAYPDWRPRVLLQEQQKVVDVLRAQEKQPGFEYMAYDYFDTQTVQAHGYIYRWIFMDNTDDQCRTILRAMKPVFKKDTKLLLLESVMPRTGAGGMEIVVDLIEMMTTGSKTRSEEEFTNLLAGEGFEVVKIWREGERGEKVLIEAVLKS